MGASVKTVACTAAILLCGCVLLAAVIGRPSHAVRARVNTVQASKPYQQQHEPQLDRTGQMRSSTGAIQPHHPLSVHTGGTDPTPTAAGTPMLRVPEVRNAPIGLGAAGFINHFVTCRGARHYPRWAGWQEATPQGVEMYATCPEGGVVWLHSSTSSVTRTAACSRKVDCTALYGHHRCIPGESDVELFVRVVLPLMRGTFILITTGGDNLNPNDVHGAEALLASPLLDRWYTQNMGTQHRKVAPIPIGYFDPRGSSVDAAGSAPAQSLPTKNRFPRHRTVLLDSMDYNSHKSRAEANTAAVRCLPTGTAVPGADPAPFGLIHGKPIKNRTAALERYDQHTFGISPIGNGVDCYRTWEMLGLGMIPIVQSSSIDVLYTHLPVLVLKEWADLCEIDLGAAHKRLAPRFDGIEPRLLLRGYMDVDRLLRVGAEAEVAREALPGKAQLVAAHSRCGDLASLGNHATVDVCGEVVRKMRSLASNAWEKCSQTHFLWSPNTVCACVPTNLTCADAATGLQPSRGVNVYRIV